LIQNGNSCRAQAFLHLQIILKNLWLQIDLTEKLRPQLTGVNEIFATYIFTKSVIIYP